MKNNKNIVVFEQDGNKVIAKSFIDEGIAKCNSNIDKFDINIGKIISLMRLLEIDKETENRVINALFDDYKDNKMPINNSIKKVMKDRLTKLKYSSGVCFKVIDYNNNHNIKDETFKLIINSSIDTLEDTLLNNFNEYFYITNSSYYNEEILFSPTQAMKIVNIAKDRVLSKPYKLTEGYFVGLGNGCMFCSESKEISYVLSENDVTTMINWLTNILLIGGYNI